MCVFKENITEICSSEDLIVVIKTKQQSHLVEQKLGKGFSLTTLELLNDFWTWT